MTNFRFSQDFVDFRVVPATGIELDHISYTHDFLVENLPNYAQYPIYSEVIGYLSGLFANNISYFTFEKLQNFMGELSPIGCYYGSHQSDGETGYWQIVDFGCALSCFDDVETLPFSNRGYNVIFTGNENLYCDIWDLDIFLTKHAKKQYCHTDLEEVLQEEQNNDYGSMLKDFIIIKIIPLMIDEETMTWRLSDNGSYWGVYPYKPEYQPNHHQIMQTSDLIERANIFQKLMFLTENKQSEKLNNPYFYKHPERLNEACFEVLVKAHYMPFENVMEETKTFDIKDMAEYVIKHPNLLEWFIIDACKS